MDQIVGNFDKTCRRQKPHRTGGSNKDYHHHHQAINMDLVLAEVGHFGLYQFRLFALILFPILFSAAFNSQYVFNAADVKYRCFVPECENRSEKFEPGDWAEWALVSGSSCHRWEQINKDSEVCEPDAFAETQKDCDAWVYETNNTIVAEFDLACQDFKRTLVGTIHSIGVFTCLIFIGIVSDTIGRRTTLILTAVWGATMGIIRSFANSYIFYVIFEYLEAVMGAGIYSTGFILVIEMVGKERRVLCGSIVACVFSLGLVSLAAIAWAVPYWRTLTRVIYAPAFLCIFYFFFLSESVRWLVSKEKTEKTIHVLQKVANMNRKRLSLHTIKIITDISIKDDDDADTEKIPVWKQVFSSGILVRRVFVCAVFWMTTTFVYYGLSINSVSLMGNMYVNFMLTAVAEIPGYGLSNLLLDRFGRKRSLMAAYFISGSSSLLIIVIPKEYDLYPVLFAKVFISLAFVSIYIFTTELFPTSLRHTLMAACSLMGRIGSILAPLSPLLLKVNHWLVYALFGAVSFAAAILLTLTPETLRRPLPETITQAEQLHTTPESPPSGTNIAGDSSHIQPDGSNLLKNDKGSDISKKTGDVPSSVSQSQQPEKEVSDKKISSKENDRKN